MSNQTKIWLIIAASLILIGGIVFAGVMSVLNWDFTKLSTNKYETNNHEISESFSAISVKTDTADIVFVPTDASKCSVECYEEKNLKHSVTVKDGTLVIEKIDTRKWYEHISIGFDTQKIMVYIPQGEYGELIIKSSTGAVEIPKDFTFESIDISVSTGKVKCLASASDEIKIATTTGNIYAENITAKALDLSASTGDVTVSEVTCEGDVKIKVSTGRTRLRNVNCKSIISSGSTGNISLKNVIASEKFSIERSTGYVKFEGSDAAEIYIKTDTGNVKGSLLSEKIFIVNTDTGSVNVPKTLTGGKCEITTDTGDVKIGLEQFDIK